MRSAGLAKLRLLDAGDVSDVMGVEFHAYECIMYLNVDTKFVLNPLSPSRDRIVPRGSCLLMSCLVCEIPALRTALACHDGHLPLGSVFASWRFIRTSSPTETRQIVHDLDARLLPVPAQSPHLSLTHSSIPTLTSQSPPPRPPPAPAQGMPRTPRSLP